MIPTPEEELEAAIWQAMKRCGATVTDPVSFIELLTFAAQRYAAGDSPIVTAVRREVLHRDTAEQTSPSSSGGVTGTATEQNPPGSVAYPNGSGDGGATLSTDQVIPGDFTSRYGRISTGVDSGYPQGVDGR